jgi:PAS domain S-box-containing protein
MSSTSKEFGFFSYKSFTRRIGLSILLIGILVTLATYIFYSGLYAINQKSSAIATELQPVKIHAFASFQYTNQVISTLQANVYGADQRSSAKINEDVTDLWKKKALPHFDTLKLYAVSREEPELKVIYEAIEDRMNKLNGFILEAVKLNKEDNRVPLYLSDKQDVADTLGFVKSNKAITRYNDKLAFLLTNEIGRLQKELNVYYNQLIDYNNKTVQGFQESVAQLQENLVWVFLIILLVLVISIVVITVYQNKYINTNFEKVMMQVEELASGGLPNAVRTGVKELDYISEKLGTVTKNLQNLKKFALSVSQGKYEVDVDVFGGKGEFGEAITQMKEGLLEVSKADAIRSWRNTGLAKFSEILRRESNDLDRLSEQLIAELIKYVGANQGGVFIVNDENEQGEPYLELISAYAYNKKKFLEKKILKGQTLVGRAWQEGLPIYLTEVPNDYIEIRTGLGGANPNYIFIVPLKVNQEVQGVLEIASFHPIEPHQKEFIEQIADSVASTYSSSKVNRRTKMLLEESQRITKRMREQEEELRQNIEELQSTQEEMQRNQRELSEKEGNMRALLDNASDAIMAFNHNLKITVINKAMKNLYESIGVYLDLGRTVEEAFPGRTFEQMKKEFSRVLSGDRFTTYADVVIRGVTYYYEILYNPIYNERQRVIGASVFITDVTQQKTTEIELKIKEANLKSLINNTEDSIMAIDRNYNLLVFNDVFKKRRKEYTFKEGDNIFTTIPEHLHEEWKKYYDRALSGERFEKVIKRDLGNKKIQYREHSFNPIFNEAGEVIGVSVFAKDITEAKLAEAENQRIMATLFERQKQDKKRIEELEKELKQLLAEK